MLQVGLYRREEWWWLFKKEPKQGLGTRWDSAGRAEQAGCTPGAGRAPNNSWTARPQSFEWGRLTRYSAGLFLKTEGSQGWGGGAR